MSAIEYIRSHPTREPSQERRLLVAWSANVNFVADRVYAHNGRLKEACFEPFSAEDTLAWLTISPPPPHPLD